MPKILSLDLGITTGYAVYQTPGSYLLEYGDILEENFIQDVRGLTLKYTPTHAVAESPVIFRGELGDRLQNIIVQTRNLLKRTT